MYVSSRQSQLLSSSSTSSFRTEQKAVLPKLRFLLSMNAGHWDANECVLRHCSAHDVLTGPQALNPKAPKSPLQCGRLDPRPEYKKPTLSPEP